MTETTQELHHDAEPLAETTPELEALFTEETKDVVVASDTLASHYEGFTVLNEIGYRDAAEDLKIIKEQQKALEEQRFAITRPMDESKRRVLDFFRPFADRLADAERHIKAAMLEWKKAEDARVREEQRKAREKAEREEAKLRKQAEAAEEKGRDARAETLHDRADAVVPEPVAPAPTKVKGISTRTVWKFEITDPSQVPDEYKTIDEKKIGGVVRALKGDAKIPGVRVYPEETMSAGRG